IMATIVSIYEDPDSGRPQMATVRPGALPVHERPAPECEALAFRPTAPAEDIGDRIELEPRPEGETEIDLEDYEVIVSVGMGVGDRETIDAVVEPFRAAFEEWADVPVGLGCSRAMVDAGMLPHSHQVGQTGVVVKPKIYIALGISGAIQHKIGMENARTIVAVNRDPHAPIQGFADYVIRGDVGQVLPVLTGIIRADS
ncbi:MAG: electron transfer flavoprotein subunit alpha/FixB family protein, partial [Planctomycetota bacterium]